MAGIKTIIKSAIEKHTDAAYRLTVKHDVTSYSEWISKREETLPKYDMSVSTNNLDGEIDIHKISYAAKYEGVSVRIIPYSSVLDNFSIKSYIEDILIFVNGELTEWAVPLIVEEFGRRSSVNVVYGDEDIISDEMSERNNPYYKPSWSPNTFLDHFYFCNIVAIRRGAFRLFEWSNGYTGAASIYHTLLRYLFNDYNTLVSSVGRISEILVHTTDYQNNFIKDSASVSLAGRLRVKTDNLISVIIPSKDNPNLLDPAIRSLINNVPSELKLEIIVVDNGSSEENLIKIKKLQDELGFIHIYEPMEFNFAKMCNLGAEIATGSRLMLLNDDVTVVSSKSIEALFNETVYAFTGAAGIKLLYPDTTRIQHAGVINTRIGPAHKLQFMDDKEDYYLGFNKSVNNVLAVTGACIMIRKDVYNEVNGMNEDFKVAFNDMDLCFKLCEKGYSNVCLNNVYMYHAESITRGRDTTSEAIVRLWNERNHLYEVHPAFKAYDPYYSKNFVNDCLDTRFISACEYEFDKANETVTEFSEVDLTASRDEPCIQIGIEYAGDLKDYLFSDTDGQDEAYYIQGFSYLLGSDNALYRKKLILSSKDLCYVTGIKSAVRSDVSANCPNEVNVERSGFSIIIPKDSLPEGSYRVGIMYEKMYSRETLFRYTNNYIVISQ